MALQSVGKCSLASPGAVSAPEQEQAGILRCAPVGMGIHLVGEGKGWVSAGPEAAGLGPGARAQQKALCARVPADAAWSEGLCGSSARASQRSLCCLSKRVTNAPRHLVPEPFPHELQSGPALVT